MEKMMSVAKTMYDMYEKKFHENMDQMKMHKMMYFAQRESIIKYGEFLFEDDFHAWKYGAVLKAIRSRYIKFSDSPFDSIKGSVSDKTKDLLNFVIEHYGTMSSWSLSCLSHAEISWLQAREGLESSDNGDRKMLKKLIELDADREKLAREMGTSLIEVD